MACWWKRFCLAVPLKRGTSNAPEKSEKSVLEIVPPTQLTASCIENVMLLVTRNIPHRFFPCDFSLESGAKLIEPGIVMINGHEASSEALQQSICPAVYSCCRKSSAASCLFRTATSGRIPKLCGTSASQNSF